MPVIRLRRKLISSTFEVQGQLCKIFLEPLQPYKAGHWIWNVGFAVGKSRRQLNDWYKRRKNKRRRSLHNRMVGTSGIKALARGFDRLLLLRWNLPPGDVLTIDCTSGSPDHQFLVFHRWQKHHPDCIIDYSQQKFFWYRPPYPDDVTWKLFNVIPVTPENPRQHCAGENYFDCFRVQPKDVGKLLSNEETLALLSQLL